MRSLDRIVTGIDGVPHKLKGKIMNGTVSPGRNGKDGYLVVNLRKNGKAHVVAIHLLVANAFIANPNNYPTVNHIDGNKYNNNVDNLEWASYAYNNTHALQTGLRKPRGTKIIQKDKKMKIISQYNSVCEASRKTGIGRSMISHCVNGRCKQAGGYYWEKL